MSVCLLDLPNDILAQIVQKVVIKTPFTRFIASTLPAEYHKDIETIWSNPSKERSFYSCIEYLRKWFVYNGRLKEQEFVLTFYSRRFILVCETKTLQPKIFECYRSYEKLVMKGRFYDASVPKPVIMCAYAFAHIVKNKNKKIYDTNIRIPLL